MDDLTFSLVTRQLKPEQSKVVWFTQNLLAAALLMSMLRSVKDT
jgi:hypothetical protein